MCFPSVFRTSETDWEYSTVGQNMPSIIDLLKKRGQKVDYDLWAAQGPDYKIWDYNHCIEAFKAVENIAHKSSDEEFKNYHGFNGLFYIQDSNSSDSFDIIRNVFKVVKNL
ncbi:uncharacterized protein OCT59_003033 [Rhizophagus irregularis]|uniref:Uncharacterized protein n=2 Tax=Rhizophagus irregularis TaxID=588596 RepID=A0A915ZMC1_9GLOM|nr:hypothetical protein OCT59_003033 [Rhizophagus irregularis]CAB4481357.1 unnamed protein product [Rhizophagus irregularis]CAB5211319.1 unnamed protein product [Rhizophagus irregularis]CAB5383204.1 unnamed protein product [Rhizophagus irregularis]CAG8516390.1 1115_t:CDS:2 [Rhizophagus irregularis]